MKRKSIVILICLYCLSPTRHVSMEVSVFDVGQGNCNLVKLTGGAPLLYDAGSSTNPSSSEGKTVTRKI